MTTASARMQPTRSCPMATIFFRTLILYAILMAALRLMGKRQIGELELSELVTTLLISEIASLPIGDPSLPLSHAVLPIVTLVCLEILSSFLFIKVPFLKNLFSSRPSVLVKDGKPLLKELRRARISIEELISSLRQKGFPDIAEIAYAILEPNGQISVLPTCISQPPSAALLKLSPEEKGIAHILIADGKIDRHNIKNMPNGKMLLERALQREGCRAEDVLLLLVNDAGESSVIRKDRKRHSR